MHKFDIICISESYFYSDTSSKIENKLGTIVSLYKSSSQSADEFDNFLNKLNLTMKLITQKNLFLTVAFGDFHARSSK